MALPAILGVITRPSRWVSNGCPTACAFCRNPFPLNETGERQEAHIGADGKLYCFSGACEADALEARVIRRTARH
jgi:organic radical activating enzyme